MTIAPTILIVDDNVENLTVLGEMLRGAYKVRAANCGERALRLAQQQPRPELILLDVMMPAMDGHAVLKALRHEPSTREIPVIFVTAMGATEDEQQGLALGAVDYIAKPLRPGIVLARVHTHLELQRARSRLRQHNRALAADLERQARHNRVIQDISIRVLARLAETRDNETGLHILRTQEYVRTLARRASGHPRFAKLLTGRNIDLIAKSAPLHDIGKVGIPDAVLHKPGPLTADEWVVMKTHARLGADAISRAESDALQPMRFLAYAKQIALHHHEKWDGSGYPDGLAGDAIPLAARLMAIADVFDALISRRVYKPALPFAQARSLMRAQRGLHFDPDLLDAFDEAFEEFCVIARTYADDVEDPQPVQVQAEHVALAA